MMKSRTLLACLLGTCLIVLAPLPTMAQDVKIGVSFDKVEPFREAQKAGLDAAIAAAGASQSFANADKDAQRQASQVDSLISEGVGAIIAIPWDIEAAVTIAQVAEASGIPFITMDQAPADLEAVTYHVGGDPCADGRAAGEFFVKVADGQPFKLLEIQGSLSNDNGIRRSSCLNEALASAGNVSVVAQVPTDWNTERAMIATQNTLQEHPDLNGIYVPFNDGLNGVFSALEARGRLKPVGEDGHVTIVSIDGLPIGCKAVQDGFLDLDIATPIPAMSTKAVEAALKASAGEELQAKAEFLPGVPYGKADLEAKADELWGCK
ncbi:substrate-binding domain-containing protein [Paracoccus sp. YIM 132242]|uniref:Substrate-binding domain-containing protein n=1 Tax=Paracoccus lichenicola TaxID=2665644 RepID=A0A6L6HUE7_9RHOB|nr:sugar ABC transporter substrate-binding protein [Paracoccus lichenicola]MTE02039.1 substrate-binding domain-containing protein [Paracoccus lichenicola]